MTLFDYVMYFNDPCPEGNTERFLDAMSNTEFLQLLSDTLAELGIIA